MCNQPFAERRGEIDLARSMPLMFLPLVHCYEEFSSLGMLNPTATSIGKILLYLCAFGPSIFMMVLGMNINFSSNTNPRKLFKRGLITMLLFVLLNIARGAIPALLGYIFVRDSEVLQIVASLVFQSDILMFAGISFLFFALMKKLKVAPLYIMLISFVLLAGSMLFPLDMPINMWTGLLGNFIRVNNCSIFPAMSWLVYPSIGYFIGEKLTGLQTKNDIKKFYCTLVAIGTTTMITISIALYAYNYNPILISAAVVRENVTDVFNVLLDVSLAWVWLGISYAIWQMIKSEKTKTVIITFSKAILVFYIVHWIIVGWTEVVFAAFLWKTNSINIWIVLLCAVVITVLSWLITLHIQKKREVRKLQTQYKV